MRTVRQIFAYLSPLLLVGTSLAANLETAITYQGWLNRGGAAATGKYDFVFRLFTNATVGPQFLPSVTNSAVDVKSGVFTTLVDFGGKPTEWQECWLELAVRTNGIGLFETLTPRQVITATPFAWVADQAAEAAMAVTATTASAVANNSVTAAGIASGQVVKSLNGLRDAVTVSAGANVTVANVGNDIRISATPASVVTNTGWGLSGNTGTASTNFLGTTDGQPLEMRVNNSRVMRYELNGSGGAPNLIGGAAHNLAGSGVVGATIGGGGAVSYGGSPWTNRIDASMSTISGGGGNRIQNQASESTIGGGVLHTVATNSHESAIGGGYRNTIQPNAYSATISGGADNLIGAGAFRASIAGGYINTNRGAESAIGGGYKNLIQATGTDAVIAGGILNTITGPYGTIAGGHNNYVASAGGMVLGGEFNSVNGINSFAGGTSAQASHDGTFVWSDRSGSQTWSTGPNQFIIRSKGGVGINNNAPQSDLSVAGGMNVDQSAHNDGTPTNILTFGSYSGEGIGSQRVGPENRFGLDFYTSYQKRMSITQGGAVGIGTSAPEQALTVVGGLTLDFGNANSGTMAANVLSFGAYSGEGIGSARSGAENAMGLDFYTSFQKRLSITQGGDVGIGTTAPQAYLHVAGSWPGWPLLALHETEANELARLELKAGSTPAWQITAGGAGNRLNFSQSGIGDLMALDVDHANFIDPILVLQSGGTKVEQFFQTRGGTWGFQAWGSDDPTVPDRFSMMNSDRQAVARFESDGNLWAGGTLSLGDGTCRMGSQSGVSYFRCSLPQATGNGFAWYLGGEHASGSYDAGGGYELMRLNYQPSIPIGCEDGSFSVSGYAYLKLNGGLNIEGNAIAYCWNSRSDRNAKRNFAEVDTDGILEKVVSLPITTWSYTNQVERHIGPMAQDFAAAFALGPDDKHISNVDADGVALAAIQGLYRRMEEKNAALERQVAEQQAQIQTLQQRLDRIEEFLSR